MQLDLFVHSRDVMLRNDVVAALRARDAVAGRQALAILSAEQPSDSWLTPLAALLNAVAAHPKPLSNHDEAVDVLQTMETIVAPAAHLVFGAEEARAWLAPVWQALARSAVGLTYDVKRPHAHAAFMFLQSGDCVAAEAQIAKVPSWRRIPASLAWMAEARFGQDGLESAWCLLAELAWIDASLFGALARRLEAPGLRALLKEFDVNFECDGEPDLAWFPAWALIAEPGLAPLLRRAQPCSNTVPERAARLVMELYTLERQGRHAELVDLRKRLRDLHAGLFARYMSTR